MDTSSPSAASEQKLPLYAIVQRGTKKVKGRVLSYSGNGYFEILIYKDIRLHKHRDALTFTNK